MNENRRAIWSWAFIDGANSAFTLLVTTALARVGTQFVRFSAVIAFGQLGEKIGAQRCILLGVALYVGLCFSAAQMTTSLEFSFIALVVGLVRGGVQSLCRSFFALSGPVLPGSARLLPDSTRYVLALLPLFVAGGWLLSKVQDDARIPVLTAR